jgi:sulfite reductase (NADPH) hemoprotein beta-component
VGDRVGPGFAADEIVPAVERIVDTYLDLRSDASELFIDTYKRIGMAPFKSALYPQARVAAE